MVAGDATGAGEGGTTAGSAVTLAAPPGTQVGRAEMSRWHDGGSVKYIVGVFPSIELITAVVEGSF